MSQVNILTHYIILYKERGKRPLPKQKDSGLLPLSFFMRKSILGYLAR